MLINLISYKVYAAVCQASFLSVALSKHVLNVCLLFNLLLLRTTVKSQVS